MQWAASESEEQTCPITDLVLLNVRRTLYCKSAFPSEDACGILGGRALHEAKLFRAESTYIGAPFPLLHPHPQSQGAELPTRGDK